MHSCVQSGHGDTVDTNRAQAMTRVRAPGTRQVDTVEPRARDDLRETRVGRIRWIPDSLGESKFTSENRATQLRKSDKAGAGQSEEREAACG